MGLLKVFHVFWGGGVGGERNLLQSKTFSHLNASGLGIVLVSQLEI